MQLVLALRLVAHCDYLSWQAGQIGAVVGRLSVGAGVVHVSCGLLDVQTAVVVAGSLFFRVAEHSAQILHEYGAEVLVAAVVAQVVGRATPQRFFVELYLIPFYAAEQTGTQLAVADGQRVFHPHVGHACGRGGLIVPKGQGMFRRVCRSANDFEIVGGLCVSGCTQQRSGHKGDECL